MVTIEELNASHANTSKLDNNKIRIQNNIIASITEMANQNI